jgi:AcrR family transcriptional regulator
LDVRAKILTEATRLFAQKGCDATSLQEISDAVGVRKPSLLYHFPSKEALHESVMESVLARWNEALPRLLHAAAREDRFDAILDECISFFAADPDRARLLLREALDRPVEMRALLHRHATAWVGVIAESIQKAQLDGSMREDVDAEAYVLQIVHLVIGTFSVGPMTSVLLGRAATVEERSQKTRASNARWGEPRRALPDEGGRESPPLIGPRLVRELKRIARASLIPSKRGRT